MHDFQYRENEYSQATHQTCTRCGLSPEYAKAFNVQCEAATSAVSPEPPVRERVKAGDTICQTCGLPNPCWFIESKYWNLIVPEISGVLCGRCFMEEAARLGVTGCWQLVPDPDSNSLAIGETPVQRRLVEPAPVPAAPSKCPTCGFVERGEVMLRLRPGVNYWCADPWHAPAAPPAGESAEKI